MTRTLAEATALFGRRRDAWLAEDVGAYLDCWVDDLVLEVPGRRIVGRDAYEDMVRRSFAWAAAPAVRVPPSRRWPVTSSTRTGRSRSSAAADAAEVEWRGMSVAELRDGRIVWWREFYEDPAALARARNV